MTDGPSKQAHHISISTYVAGPWAGAEAATETCRKRVGPPPGSGVGAGVPVQPGPYQPLQSSGGPERSTFLHKPASRLHVGRNAAKLWDAGNLALKRHNYRVRLTERQQSPQTGAKTRRRVRRQSSIYACECQLTKHKPDGPKRGSKLKPPLFSDLHVHPIFAETGRQGKINTSSHSHGRPGHCWFRAENNRAQQRAQEQTSDQARRRGHKRQMLPVTQSNEQTLVLNCLLGGRQLLK